MPREMFVVMVLTPGCRSLALEWLCVACIIVSIGKLWLAGV